VNRPRLLATSLVVEVMRVPYLRLT
jgi:hypothetical protein